MKAPTEETGDPGLSEALPQTHTRHERTQIVVVLSLFQKMESTGKAVLGRLQPVASLSCLVSLFPASLTGLHPAHSFLTAQLPSLDFPGQNIIRAAHQGPFPAESDLGLSVIVAQGSQVQAWPKLESWPECPSSLS